MLLPSTTNVKAHYLKGRPYTPRSVATDKQSITSAISENSALAADRFCFRLAYLLCRQSTAFATMKKFMGIYVAQRFMWRSPRDARKDALSRPTRRHIT
jgi:hypothetical protein